MLPARRTFEGVSPAAFVDRSARLGTDVGIGPLTYVGAGVRIGDRTEVHPSSTIGHETRIGDDCVIHSGVHIYPRMVIGHRVDPAQRRGDWRGRLRLRSRTAARRRRPADEPHRHRKIRHVGSVIIEDDVEIGANTTIDRATLARRASARGTKIDNLVTIGHNSDDRTPLHHHRPGRVSGSTTLGDYVTVAGQAGLAGHIRIGSTR